MSTVCSTPDRRLTAAPANAPGNENAGCRWRRALGLAAGAALLAGLAGPLVAASSLAAEPLEVEVTNASEPVLCAEKDNVTLNLSAPTLRQFRITALHPAYMGTLQRDNHEADWSACTAPGDPRAGPPQPPRRTTLYEDIELWVVGLSFREFWRPATASVRVGDRLAKDIHLLQVWMLRPMGGEEVLVLYPQDGYWRLRPKAPLDRAPTAFGSSVLIGPVEMEGRPIVKIAEVAFDPRQRSFSLRFERGGSAQVSLVRVDEASHVLDVSFDKPISGRPFAALRSMYVTDFNNDVARIALRQAAGWREQGIMAFDGGRATELWAGRLSPSRHNTSSPDLLFGGFNDEATGKPTAK
jgi:hypothetical protein